MKQQIKAVIARAILKESEKKEENKHRKCNKLINKIKGDIDALAEIFEDMGIDTDSTPYRQLKKMYKIMIDFDPIEEKLAEYFKMPTKNSAMGMIQSEGDIKIPTNSDKDTEKKAIDMSSKYNKDIELKSDEEETESTY